MMARGTYRHEALFYEGTDGFLDAAETFVDDGLAAGEDVMVMVAEPRLSALADRLGPRAGEIELRDMGEVGKNPARIIPAWAEFVDGANGRPIRGIGEPIWAGRDPDEMVECHHHESLLNEAIDSETPFWLLCPYDVSALEPAALHTACGNHPYLSGKELKMAFDARLNGNTNGMQAPFSGPLTDLRKCLCDFDFDRSRLSNLRSWVRRYALEAGLDDDAAMDLVVVANELATNSIRHGGGTGHLTLFEADSGATVEVRDAGRIEDPLVGRRRPDPEQVGGRGIWLVNQLADLVQIRNTPEGCVIRARISADN